MSKILLLSLCFPLSFSTAFADNLPPHPSGKTYISENAGNWIYLPKTDKSGQKNIICLALASAPPYAITFRGIKGEFGLSVTNKNWHVDPTKTASMTVHSDHLSLNKTAYPLDQWTLSALLSPQEKNELIASLSKSKTALFSLSSHEHFTLPLYGSARILSLLTDCMNESGFSD